VATSFSASYLTYLRSPYYGIGYGANDVVLIVLWAIASAKDLAYLPMVACFVMFLANDIYGFINWRRMRRRQQEHTH
jgi:nicotinamide riboside transporter PnuC